MFVTAMQLPAYGGNLETAFDDIRHYLAGASPSPSSRRGRAARNAMRSEFCPSGSIAAALSPRLRADRNGSAPRGRIASRAAFVYPNSALAVMTTRRSWRRSPQGAEGEKRSCPTTA
jgi:hypothetical protein